MKKILIADDEKSIRQLVIATIGGPEYQILEAPDGQIALELAQKDKPDLILLDMKMPYMTGLEVCRALKSDPETSSITIVMLTAVVDVEQRRLSLEAGVNDYLTKPFSPIALLNKIEEILA